MFMKNTITSFNHKECQNKDTILINWNVVQLDAQKFTHEIKCALTCLCFVFLTVFDEHVRRSKAGGGNTREMDFESFLDFVLALENKDTPEGLTYLFKCLDLQGRGYLTTADIHMLFRFCSFTAIVMLHVHPLQVYETMHHAQM